MKITDDIIEMLESPSTAKMIGTVGSKSDIHLEYVTSIRVTGNDEITLPFFNKNSKTIENIKNNAYVSLSIVQPPVIGYKCNGILKRIVEKDAFKNHFETGENNTPLGVIIIRITDIFALTMAIAGHKID